MITEGVKTLFLSGSLLFFLSGCGGAGFDSGNTLNSYYLNYNLADESFSVFSQTINKDGKPELINKVEIKNSSLVYGQPEDAENESFLFSNSVTAYRSIPEVEGAFEFYVSPLLSRQASFNSASTALYLTIKNSLPTDQFSALEIDIQDWNDMLFIFENECRDCLSKGFKENVDALLSGERLKEIKDILKAKASSGFNWDTKELQEWQWELAQISPSPYGGVVRVYEGEDTHFTARAFHPSTSRTLHSPTSWVQNFTGEDVQLDQESFKHTFPYDSELNVTYPTHIIIENMEFPHFDYLFKVEIINTNRAPIIKEGSPDPYILTVAEGDYLREYDICEEVFEELDSDDAISNYTLEGNSLDKLYFSSYPPRCGIYLWSRYTLDKKGDYHYKLYAYDSENAQSKPLNIIIRIVESTPPEILYVYLNDDPSTKYYDGDTIDLNEGDPNQSIHVVSSDFEKDRVYVGPRKYNDFEYFGLTKNHQFDSFGNYGVLEPTHKNSNGALSYVKYDYLFNYENRKYGYVGYKYYYDLTNSDYVTYDEQTGQSETKFKIKPSYYSTLTALHSEKEIVFEALGTVNQDQTAFINLIYPLPSISLNVRVHNVDDPPPSPGSYPLQPAIENTNTYSQNLDSNQFADAPLRSSPTKIIFSSQGEKNKVCEDLFGVQVTPDKTRATIFAKKVLPFDSPEICALAFRIEDSLMSLDPEAKRNLYSSKFQVEIPITNSNHPPRNNYDVDGDGLSDTVLELGDIYENEPFSGALFDQSPDNGVLNGIFYDRDYNLSDSDPTKHLIDPREIFSFDCEISELGANNFQPCGDVGINFLGSHQSLSSFTANYSVLGPEVSKQFTIRFKFKDRESSDFIHQDANFTLINSPAPVEIHFSDTSKTLAEKESENIELFFKRFSEHPIDNYPFTSTILCSSCSDMVKSIRSNGLSTDYSGQEFSDPSTNNVIGDSISIFPDYHHGDGIDGKSETYNLTINVEGVKQNYDPNDNTPLLRPILQQNSMLVTINHVNRPPEQIYIDSNQDTSTFTRVYSYLDNNNNTLLLPLQTLDPDPQDTQFIYSADDLNSNAVTLSGNNIKVDFKTCAYGGSTLTKSFTLTSTDPGGVSITRSVTISINNIKPSSVCK